MSAQPNGRSLAIELQNVVKSYAGVGRALDNLSFSVEAGTIFALLGPNGAGKSTIVKILSTLSRPDQGTVRVAGFDALRKPERVRQVIGCVGQRPGFDGEATGRENMELQGRFYGLDSAKLHPRVRELLEYFGLSDAADRPSHTYSGGMQRKLDIAMSLIHRPRVLLLDEPTVGLDPEVRRKLHEELIRLSTTEQLTILVTTHYLEEADHLARQLAFIMHGRLVAMGSAEQLKGELLGDFISVELFEVTEADRLAPLAHENGIHDIVIEGRFVYARAKDGARAVPDFLAALRSTGLNVAAVRVTRPSLDDVYLRHTAGHSA
jgi:ABC-2 type transport system ATP-binding protein